MGECFAKHIYTPSIAVGDVDNDGDKDFVIVGSVTPIDESRTLPQNYANEKVYFLERLGDATCDDVSGNPPIGCKHSDVDHDSFDNQIICTKCPILKSYGYYGNPLAETDWACEEGNPFCYSGSLPFGRIAIDKNGT